MSRDTIDDDPVGTYRDIVESTAVAVVVLIVVALALALLRPDPADSLTTDQLLEVPMEVPSADP